MEKATVANKLAQLLLRVIGSFQTITPQFHSKTCKIDNELPVRFISFPSTPLWFAHFFLVKVADVLLTSWEMERDFE